MHPDVIMLTRWVADHAAAIDWYATLFGRAPDRAPVLHCREWDLLPGVVFQVIEQSDKAGATSFALGVPDLAAQEERLASAGVDATEAFDVTPFDGLRYVEYADPEGVTTGLLNSDAIGDVARSDEA